MILLIGLFSPVVFIFAQQEDDWEASWGKFTDERDGQVYEWVKIGDQIWMAQNLNIGKIIYIRDSKIVDSSIEKFCYDGRQENCIKYGGLYTNYTMNQYTTGEGARSICPGGWHLPSETEWMVLINNLGGMEIAGAALKKSRYRKWSGPDMALADSIGFNALPGGYCTYSNYTINEYGLIYPDFTINFDKEGKMSYFWTSTESITLLFPRNDFRAIGLAKNKDKISPYNSSALAGLSVRCIKDHR